MRSVRVVVLDDSAICRQRLREILESDPEVVVVGEAANGDTVLELIRRTKPTILVVDLQMPGTGGHQTIERVMANHPLPILVVTSQPSGVTQASVFESIRRGALDLAEKPMRADRAAEARLRALVRELSRVPVVRHMGGSLRKPRLWPGRPSSRPPPPGQAVPIAGIGASAGGPLAVGQVLVGIPPDFPAALAVVQHLPKGFASAFADFLRTRTTLPVIVVTRRMSVFPATVYVAPDDRHLVALDSRHLGPSDEPEVDGHRPAVDALLRTLAETLGARAAGVVMSGIGRDGCSGLALLKMRGGLTLAQDEASSGVFGMPRAALESKAALRALDPVGIGAALRNWALELNERRA